MGLPEFRNEPFTDFTQEPNQQAMRRAVAAAEVRLGIELPLVRRGAHPH
jgi:1-pyrroline-5-carboxylate dehydrogenase